MWSFPLLSNEEYPGRGALARHVTRESQKPEEPLCMFSQGCQGLKASSLTISPLCRVTGTVTSL